MIGQLGMHLGHLMYVDGLIKSPVSPIVTIFHGVNLTGSNSYWSKQITSLHDPFHLCKEYSLVPKMTNLNMIRLVR